MHTVQVIQLQIAEQQKASIDATIQSVATTLRDASTVEAFTVGTEVKNDSALQIVLQASPDSKNNENLTDLLDHISKISAKPPTTFHITLNNPPFASSSGAATAPVVEYVQQWFPTAKATREFRQQIEQDFLKFKQIFDREAKQDLGRAYGWVEEVEREDIEGGKAMSFIVVTGWEKLEDFEASVATDSFKEAIPILMAWAAPYRMWFVERRAAS